MTNSHPFHQNIEYTSALMCFSKPSSVISDVMMSFLFMVRGYQFADLKGVGQMGDTSPAEWEMEDRSRNDKVSVGSNIAVLSYFTRPSKLYTDVVPYSYSQKCLKTCFRNTASGLRALLIESYWGLAVFSNVSVDTGAWEAQSSCTHAWWNCSTATCLQFAIYLTCTPLCIKASAN